MSKRDETLEEKVERLLRERGLASGIRPTYLRPSYQVFDAEPETKTQELRTRLFLF